VKLNFPGSEEEEEEEEQEEKYCFYGCLRQQ